MAQLPDGQLLVPAVNGLFATGAGTLGCGLRLAEGSLATRPVADVAVAPAAGASVPVGQTAVWALGADIDGARRSLHLSGDGGARFAVKQPLPEGVITNIPPGLPIHARCKWPATGARSRWCSLECADAAES